MAGDAGAFDHDRYWVAEVWYAKADPADVLMTVRVTNAGPEADTVHVLPTAWFRNTWSWDLGAPKPGLALAGDSAIGIEHPFLGSLELLAGPGPDGTVPVPDDPHTARVQPARAVDHQLEDGLCSSVP